MLAAMPLAEFKGWVAYYRFQRSEQELPSSMLACTIANHVTKPKEPFSLQEFHRWPLPSNEIEEQELVELAPLDQLKKDSNAAGWVLPDHVLDIINAA